MNVLFMVMMGALVLFLLMPVFFFLALGLESLIRNR